MNREHRELLASDDWREVLETLAFPFAFGGRGYGDLGDEVLEVGPGPGLATDLLRPHVPRLTAIELDPDLAGELRRRLAGTRIGVIEGDATAMPLEDGRFSGVVSFTMFHHVPTAELQDRLLAEVCRVLRPGGLFIANDSVPSDDLAALHVDDVYCPVDPATLPARLAAAGFVDVDVRDNPFAWASHARCPG